MVLKTLKLTKKYKVLDGLVKTYREVKRQRKVSMEIHETSHSFV